MSYVIEVKRTGDKPSLTKNEFEKLMNSDESLVSAGEYHIVWNKSQDLRPLHLNIETDRLWTDEIYGDAQAIYLDKLREIARFLDARVFGEEGEDLTEDDPDDPSGPRHPFATAAGLFVFAVTVPVLAIMFIVRLPWILWKVSRTLR